MEITAPITVTAPGYGPRAVSTTAPLDRALRRRAGVAVAAYVLAAAAVAASVATAGR